MNENNFNFILFSGRIAAKRIGEEEKFRSATTTGSWIYFQVTKNIFGCVSFSDLGREKPKRNRDEALKIITENDRNSIGSMATCL